MIKFSKPRPNVLLTPPLVAEQLGVSLTTVYRLVERRQIRFVRVARTIRFRQEDVDAFIERGAVNLLP